MTKFFRLHTSVELNDTQTRFQSLYNEFSEDFVQHNKFLKTQKAIVHYNNRGKLQNLYVHTLNHHLNISTGAEFAEAEREFDELIQSDPYRLDDMDIYSNVLYVMDRKAKLSFLAHMSATTDKYRSETMCIIGM